MRTLPNRACSSIADYNGRVTAECGGKLPEIVQMNTRANIQVQWREGFGRFDLVRRCSNNR